MNEHDICICVLAGRLEIQTKSNCNEQKNNSIHPRISLLGPHTLLELSCFSVSLAHGRVASSALAAFGGKKKTLSP